MPTPTPMTFEDVTPKSRYRRCRLRDLHKGDTCVSAMMDGQQQNSEPAIGRVLCEKLRGAAGIEVCMFQRRRMLLLDSGETTFWKVDMLVEPVTVRVLWSRQELGEEADDEEA